MGLATIAGGVMAAGSAIASAVGAGSPQKLEKLRIWVEDGTPQQPFSNKQPDPIPAMFNPASITYTLKANWQPVASKSSTGAQNLHFTDLAPQTLRIDIYFDTSEPPDGADSSDPVDVRQYTDRVSALARLYKETHRPPLCRLCWGKPGPGGLDWFEGVATNILHTFTYFHKNGTPLRAKLTCDFSGWNSRGAAPGQEKQSTDVYKVHVVKQGETLSSISQQRLHNATLWRAIAEANGITDPLTLVPGTTLHIPTVGTK